MSTAEPDPRVTKRRVTMSVPHVPTAVLAGPVIDYVREDFLQAYLADAATRWASIEVSPEPDAGPGGYDGPTYIPHGLDHPAAGTWYPATPGHPAADLTPPVEARVVAAPPSQTGA